MNRVISLVKWAQHLSAYAKNFTGLRPPFRNIILYDFLLFPLSLRSYCTLSYRAKIIGQGSSIVNEDLRLPTNGTRLNRDTIAKSFPSVDRLVTFNWFPRAKHSLIILNRSNTWREGSTIKTNISTGYRVPDCKCWVEPGSLHEVEMSFTVVLNYCRFMVWTGVEEFYGWTNDSWNMWNVLSHLWKMILFGFMRIWICLGLDHGELLKGYE